MDDGQAFDIDSAITVLIDKGLVDKELVLSNEIFVESGLRRNRNFQVLTTNGGLFVKQPDPLSPGSYETIRAEVSFYEHFVSSNEFVKSILPRLKYSEQTNTLLALELLSDHKTFWRYCNSYKLPQFPIQVCREIGRRVGTLQGFLKNRFANDTPYSKTLNSNPPWVSKIHQPSPKNLTTLGPAGTHVLQMIQASSIITAGLDDFAKAWERTTIIHGDIKADNILIKASGPTGYDIRIVDWEMVQIGDPAWDAAGFLHDLVLFWLKHLSYTDKDDIGLLVDRAGIPLEVIQTAIREFWTAYVSVAGTPEECHERAVTKVAQHIAARMIQSAYEATISQSETPPMIVLTLQVCENILADPKSAASDFLAILR